MVVDTPALMAILKECAGLGNIGQETLRWAFLSKVAVIPALVVLEFLRVADSESTGFGKQAREMLTCGCIGAGCLHPSSTSR